MKRFIAMAAFVLAAASSATAHESELSRLGSMQLTADASGSAWNSLYDGGGTGGGQPVSAVEASGGSRKGSGLSSSGPGRTLDSASVPARAVESAKLRKHVHYWDGVPETDPDNVVSSAAGIRHAGMTGHLINVLPPVALYGAARLWASALAGDRGESARRTTLVATVLVPIGAMMVATAALYSMIDNAWNAAEDAVSGHFGLREG